MRIVGIVHHPRLGRDIDPGPLEQVFQPRQRATVAGLWLVGVALAGSTAPVAWQRTGVVAALPFIAAATGLAVLAWAVLQANRAALIVSTILLGAQILGVVGSAWQLRSGVHGSKADELQRLGIDPELGVALNLLYSAIASAVFGWLITRWLRARRA
ncbi:MAG TPA: hypothetical protein VJS45_07050 [Acidimicrobiia bacterium]|nr:hypothetical protein [Acidimicrobiia bacterium]